MKNLKVILTFKMEFTSACQNGDIKKAKRLYEAGTNLHTERAFQEACGNGHFEIAKWLYSLGSKPVDIHSNNDWAFRYACMYGHFEIAKWLCDLGADIHSEDDGAFRCACMCGHLEIAKWLYSLGKPVICAKNDYTFLCACKNEYFDVAVWLYELGARLTNYSRKFKQHYKERHDSLYNILLQVKGLKSLDKNIFKTIIIPLAIGENPK